jgi:hypothetical protein
MQKLNWLSFYDSSVTPENFGAIVIKIGAAW